VIGYNARCTDSNQIVLGTVAETVIIPNNVNITNNCTSKILSFSQSLNNISPTVFGYLSGVTSSIQTQINNCNSNISQLQNITDNSSIATLLNKTTDIFWTAGQINKTTINNQCETNILTFSNTLNNISSTVFSYLNGVTSSIQDQFNEVYLNIYTYLPNNITFSINQLKNQIAPPGSIITFAGTSTSLDGYFLCDGSSYNSSNQSNLFNAIGYTYGGSNGIFKVPNYKGIFLRGNGSQDVQLNVIAGAGGPIIKNFQSVELGRIAIDQNTSFSTNNYVDNISTTNKTVVTGMSPNIATLSTTSVIGSVNYSTSNTSFNFGNAETHPVYASVQYFIKY
jgi:microcystin-dependent protein